MPLATSLNDPIVRSAPADIEPAWFDRFYFNAHSGTEVPMLMLGAGVYPVEGLADGYAAIVTESEQINLRVSDVVVGEHLQQAIGPLSWETVAPLRQWRLRLADNPSGITCELLWTARTPTWECAPVVLDDGRGGMTSFDHTFQSGRYEGWLEVDGTRYDAAGWTGQRDRSRGRRPVVAGQGLHLWVQGQFAQESVAFMLDLGRDNQLALLDGGILAEDGSSDRIVAVDHDLHFDADLETSGGGFVIRTTSGRALVLEVDSSANRGGFLAGAGYGSFHGRPHGPGYLEHDRWDLLDPRMVPRHLGYPLADRLAAFTRTEAGATDSGAGIFEFAHSRSSSYRYQPGKVTR